MTTFKRDFRLRLAETPRLVNRDAVELRPSAIPGYCYGCIGLHRRGFCDSTCIPTRTIFIVDTPDSRATYIARRVRGSDSPNPTNESEP